MAADYYDFYMISKVVEIDRALFKEALAATMRHRGTIRVLDRRDEIIAEIGGSETMKRMWDKYRREFPFARGIEFEDVVDSLRTALAGRAQDCNK